MNKKTVYIIIIVVCTLTVGIIWNRVKQANMSDDLLQQFKAVDESLQRTNDSIDKANDSIGLELEKKFDSGKPVTP